MENVPCFQKILFTLPLVGDPPFNMADDPDDGGSRLLLSPDMW